MAPDQRWMRVLLACAAGHGALAGVALLLWPSILGQPLLSRAVGTGELIQALGFGIAAIDPLSFWPLTLLGLGEKILLPMVLLNLPSGWLILANGAVWWVPLGLVLRAAWLNFLDEPNRRSPVWQRARTEWGEELGELSFSSPILLVALRHGGCTFCREALADLARLRDEIESRGTRIILAHMGDPQEGAKMASRYGLQDLTRLADPNRLVYHALGLKRGNLKQLFGLRTWMRGFRAGVLDGHGISFPAADPFQMGGVFLLDQGRIVSEFRYSQVSDRPDFVQIAAEAVPARVLRKYKG